MKRLVCVLLALCMLLSTTSCVVFNKPQTGPAEEFNADIETEESVHELEEPSEKQDDVDDHQELTKTKIEFDHADMLRMNIPEIGLENVVVRALANGNIDGKGAQVYLLGDDRYGGRNRFWADLYLVIVYDEDMIYAKDIGKWEDQPSYGEELYLSDIDGNGDSEIIVHELIAMTGGFGGYLSLVYDFSNGEIKEVFEDSSRNFDTGFQLRILKDRKINIVNRFTGYNETFDFSHRNDDYYQGYWYGGKEPADHERQDFMVDPFYEFVPEDYDNDGIFEIKCRQYTSLIGHSDFIGVAISYLKFNNETKQFEVVKADYIPEPEFNR